MAYTVNETGDIVYEDVPTVVTPDEEIDLDAELQKELARLAKENDDKIKADNDAADLALKELNNTSAKKLKADSDAALAKLLADDEAFRKEQSDLDAMSKAQIDAQAKIDADTFAKAQLNIATMMANEQARIKTDAAAYAQQQAVIQQELAKAEQEAKLAQADIAKQLLETQRISAEMSAKSKAEIDAIQRTSAAKIAGSRRAGRSAGDRSLLSAIGPAQSGPPTLGSSGGLGGMAGSLGISGTLGV